MENSEKYRSGLRKASAVVLLAVASIPYIAATASVVKAIKEPKPVKEK